MVFKKIQQYLFFILFSLFIFFPVNAADIQLNITTDIGDRAIFKQGDSVNFLLNLSEDAYLFVFYTDATGRIHRLLPEKHGTLFFSKAGWFLPVPGNDIKFIVSEPYGSEKISILALSGVIKDQDKLYQKSGSISEIVSLYREYARSNSFNFGYSTKSIQTGP